MVGVEVVGGRCVGGGGGSDEDVGVVGDAVVGGAVVGGAVVGVSEGATVSTAVVVVAEESVVVVVVVVSAEVGAEVELAALLDSSVDVGDASGDRSPHEDSVAPSRPRHRRTVGNRWTFVTNQTYMARRGRRPKPERCVQSTVERR